MFTCTINTMSDECHMTSGKTNSNNGICLYMQDGRQKGHHLLMAKVFDCFEKYGNTVPFLSCRWRPWLFLIRCGSSILCFSFRTSLLRTPSGYIWTKWCLPHVRSTPPEECETTAVFFVFGSFTILCVLHFFNFLPQHSTTNEKSAARDISNTMENHLKHAEHTDSTMCSVALRHTQNF